MDAVNDLSYCEVGSDLFLFDSFRYPFLFQSLSPIVWRFAIAVSSAKYFLLPRVCECITLSFTLKPSKMKQV
jgi:hypothetical protein